MADGLVHVVGAGLAGLSAAVRLTERGFRVVVHEANTFAGGRCRTFHDPRLEREIDNGNHLVLSGNHSARSYLATIGAEDRMVELPARFPFVDLVDGARWTVAPNAGPLPWWIAAPGRRVPGTRLREYCAATGLSSASTEMTVAQAIPGRGPLWRRFWEPLTLAAINAPPERAAARLLWPVLRETFIRGERHCRPLLAPKGLGDALVDPAVGWLVTRGMEIRFGRVLRGIELAKGRVTALRFSDGDQTLGDSDHAVLALPPSRLRAVLPVLAPPDDDCPILNLFFRLAQTPPQGTPPFLGIIGGTAQWIFLRGDVASVTVSAAAELQGRAAEDITSEIWSEVRTALRLGNTAQPVASRINRERRATFDQSPAGVAQRLDARTAWANLTLAGDSVDTGLPATIEGAIRSGEQAAQLIALSVRSY
jgi:squalene-associated FAD-dependent desaturase